MAELLPFVSNSRHAGQRAAHDLRSLLADDHNTVAIIVELADGNFLERGKKRNTDVAGFHQLHSIGVLGQLTRGAERRAHDILGDTPGWFSREMPESVAGMAVKDIVA